METLKLIHEENDCGGELLALGTYARLINGHIKWFDHFQCQKCFAIVREESDPCPEVLKVM